MQRVSDVSCAAYRETDRQQPQSSQNMWTSSSRHVSSCPAMSPISTKIGAYERHHPPLPIPTNDNLRNNTNRKLWTKQYQSTQLDHVLN